MPRQGYKKSERHGSNHLKHAAGQSPCALIHVAKLEGMNLDCQLRQLKVGAFVLQKGKCGLGVDEWVFLSKQEQCGLLPRSAHVVDFSQQRCKVHLHIGHNSEIADVWHMLTEDWSSACLVHAICTCKWHVGKNAQLNSSDASRCQHAPINRVPQACVMCCCRFKIMLNMTVCMQAVNQQTCVCLSRQSGAVQLVMSSHLVHGLCYCNSGWSRLLIRQVKALRYVPLHLVWAASCIVGCPIKSLFLQRVKALHYLTP